MARRNQPATDISAHAAKFLATVGVIDVVDLDGGTLAHGATG